MCRSIRLLLTSGAFCLVSAATACAQEGDIMKYFETEAEAVQVVTVSRLAQSLRWAPATVYVITSEDIRSSGARTLWDALRMVPGVDVMATRAFYGEVSVRGLNKSLGNRTLVLLDGRTVLNGPFDSTHWEGIPVAMEEIDRIEVVEGPASALYGANAINGVIHILTKRPDQVAGGGLAYTAGERGVHLASAVYGRNLGRGGIRGSASWRQADGFETGAPRSSRMGMGSAFWSGNVSKGSRLSLSGGLVDHDTRFSAGTLGVLSFEGTTGFLRGDLQRRSTRLRVFWNGGRQSIRDFPFPDQPWLHSDLFEVSLEHEVRLPGRNTAVVGASYRRNEVRSNAYAPDDLGQNLWALFFEEVCRISASVRGVASGRLDRHPLAGAVLSPRLSLVYSPSATRSFRLSAGSSFRYPTLTESYVALRQNFGKVGSIPIELALNGDRNLKPERLLMLEGSYTGRIGPLRTTVAIYTYRLKDLISVRQDTFALIFQPSPRIQVWTPYANYLGSTRARGGEAGWEWTPRPAVTAFGNYSYERLSGTLDFLMPSNGGPRHKLNGGFRARVRSLGFSLWAHWVDRIYWTSPNLKTLGLDSRPQEAYLLVNGHLRWEFPGRLKGTSVSVEGMNLLNRRHAEILPPVSATELGQGGEVLGRRVTATLSARF